MIHPIDASISYFVDPNLAQVPLCTQHSASDLPWRGGGKQPTFYTANIPNPEKKIFGANMFSGFSG